jgi:hypothetical protein
MWLIKAVSPSPPHTALCPVPSIHPGWLATDAHRACQPAAPVLLQFLPQQAASL